jgi:hypothetical protein
MQPDFLKKRTLKQSKSWCRLLRFIEQFDWAGPDRRSSFDNCRLRVR